MKIFNPVIMQPVAQPLNAALQLAGLVPTGVEDADFVYFGKNNNYESYKMLPEKFTNTVCLDLMIKSKLPELFKAAGINYIQSDVITDINVILDYPSDNVFIKPIEGALSRTPYTFVYKIFTSKTELLNTIDLECPDFFSMNEFGVIESSKHIIQKAIMPDSEGYNYQYFAPAYVNGQGQIKTEGIGASKLKFNSLNDVDDKTYPLRYLKEFSVRNTEDQTNKFDIFGQLQKLVDFYSIKNTPMNTQWLVDTDGQAYMIDFGYNYQRALYCNTNLITTEMFADKLRYVYDLQPDIKQPLTGWTGVFDLMITSDKKTLIEYANFLGIHVAETWGSATTEKSLTVPFVIRGYSEEECVNRVQTLRDYIEKNTKI